MNRINKPLLVIASKKSNDLTIAFSEITDKSIATKLSASDIATLIIKDDDNLTDKQREALILIIKYVNYGNLNYKCMSDELLVKDRIDLLSIIYPDKASRIRQLAFTGGKIKEL